MKKLLLRENKILKLTNVLRVECDLDTENFSIEVQLEQMRSYIRAKGADQIGPLVQHIKPKLNEQGELDVQISFLLQCSRPFRKVEDPYQLHPVLRVPNCIYCRYTGSGEELNYAYDKIKLYAFENDIKLKGGSYTIFVDQNEEDSTMTADVFMEKENE